MINRTRSIIAASIFAALTFFYAAAADAQGVPWGGCPNTTICNLTGCKVQIALRMIPVASPAYTLAPGQCLVIPTTGVTSIAGVVSAAPAVYPVLPPPPVAPCNCPAGSWSVCCVTLPSAAVCCCDICFDPLTCTINILPAACPPGACRP